MDDNRFVLLLQNERGVKKNLAFFSVLLKKVTEDLSAKGSLRGQNL